MASSGWRHEMENMLAAFNRQAIHSLSIIKRSGLSFTPEFKKYFMRTSAISINEAYDRFQVSSMFVEQLRSDLNSATIVSSRNEINAVEWKKVDPKNYSAIADESDWIANATDSVIQIDDSGYDEALIEVIETEPSDDTSAVENGATLNANPNGIVIVSQNISDAHNFNDGRLTIDDLNEIDEPIPHQSNANECKIIPTEDSSDFNFAVEMNESNDSMEMVENQTVPKDADDDELIPMKNTLNRSNKTTTAELTKGKNKATRSNRKSSNKKRMMIMKETNDNRDSLTAKGGNSSSEQSIPRKQKKCTVCGCICSTGNFSRHMRTHTGEKPYGCVRCERSFTSATSLMNHAATHIAEFPFHCRACFHGFSLKTETVAHEKHCQKRHYECYLCIKFVTFDKAELIKHMRTHTGEKPFCCEICMKGFIQKQNLKRHLNTIHA